MKNPVEGFSAGLVDDSDVFQWQVTIIGPPDTPVREAPPREPPPPRPVPAAPAAPPAPAIFTPARNPPQYEGGFFNATMSFPDDYPNKPPSVRFTSEMWHPNVYKDGRVCISILHDPGEDPHGYEEAGERWRPVHTVESILLSIISMMSSPNDESPANIDAAKMFREEYADFKKKVARIVRKSQEML